MALCDEAILCIEGDTGSGSEFVHSDLAAAFFWRCVVADVNPAKVSALSQGHHSTENQVKFSAVL